MIDLKEFYSFESIKLFCTRKVQLISLYFLKLTEQKKVYIRAESHIK